jgi:hypothetical protein
MNPFTPIPSWVASHWTISTVIACAAGMAAACRSCLETEQAKVQRVVVSERDLAEQFRKRPDAVATALNLLLGEQKVQRAPLNGYWKLNV